MARLVVALLTSLSATAPSQAAGLFSGKPWWPCNSTTSAGFAIQACELGGPQIMNRMQHINDAMKFPFERFAGIVGHVMVAKHGLKDVGAWRMHHHFKMSRGEYLVSSAAETHGGLKHVVEVKQVADLKHRLVIPIAFAFSKKDRRWWPVQFWTSAEGDPIGEALLGKYSKLNAPAGLDGLHELGHELLAAGLEDHVGLSLSWSDLIAGAGVQMVETTNETARTQQFVPHTGGAEDITRSVVTHQFFEQVCHKGPVRYTCAELCVWKLICESRTRCTSSGDGHSSDTTHSRGVDHDIVGHFWPGP